MLSGFIPSFSPRITHGCIIRIPRCSHLESPLVTSVSLSSRSLFRGVRVITSTVTTVSMMRIGMICPYLDIVYFIGYAVVVSHLASPSSLLTEEHNLSPPPVHAVSGRKATSEDGSTVVDTLPSESPPSVITARPPVKDAVLKNAYSIPLEPGRPGPSPAKRRPRLRTSPSRDDN